MVNDEVKFYCHSCEEAVTSCAHFDGMGKPIPKSYATTLGAIDVLRRSPHRTELDVIKAIKPGDVVQINPTPNTRFAGSLMIVTKIDGGIMLTGYIRAPTADGSAEYYSRCGINEVAFVGTAEWISPIPTVSCQS